MAVAKSEEFPKSVNGWWSYCKNFDSAFF